MSKIKVFLVGSVAHTPWDNDAELYELIDGVVVEDAQDADILVSRERRCFTPELLALCKPNVIWTHEPYLELSEKILAVEDGNIFYVFSMFTKTIYIDNFLYAPRDRLPPVTADTLTAPFEDKKVGVLATFRQSTRLVGGVNVSLDDLRSRLALDLYNGDMAVITGQGWPAGVAIGESRSGEWGVSKRGVLEDYNFCHCMENTRAHNYVSEKIWQSIENYCLPIYMANSSIYDTFPSDSFIDYSKLNSAEALIDMIRNMNLETFLDRLNTCIRVYNQAGSQSKRVKSQALTRQSIKRHMSSILLLGEMLKGARGNPKKMAKLVSAAETGLAFV